MALPLVVLRRFGFGLLVFAGCTGSCLPVQPGPGFCSPANCSGCCDATGGCQTGTKPGHCGAAGAACVFCATGQTCTGGACVNACTSQNCPGCCSEGVCVPACPSGQVCASGTCGAPADAGHCDATNCDAGCCLGGDCVPSSRQSASLCGASGEACGQCTGGGTCASGACSGGSCNSGNCGGCCEGGTCIPTGAQTASQCGESGAACAACRAGQVCSSLGCVTQPTCDASNCSGCCAGTTCIPPASQSNNACGSGGAQCQACNGPCDTDAGACIVNTGSCGPVSCAGCCSPDGNCHPGNESLFCGNNGGSCLQCLTTQQCTPTPNGNVCHASCSPASCPSGCCDSFGLCQSGTSSPLCGNNGEVCTSCVGSLQCFPTSNGGFCASDADAGPPPVDGGCVPQCAVRACGPDGCGGSCGGCPGLCEPTGICNSGNCSDVGQRCGVPGPCCSPLACDPDAGVCCMPSGGACSANSDCCSGACAPGSGICG